MFKKRTKKNEKTRSGDRPYDLVMSQSLEAAIWLNRVGTRGRIRPSYSFQLSRLFASRGKIRWSRTFSPEDLVELSEMIRRLADYFAQQENLPVEVRDTLFRLVKSHEIAKSEFQFSRVLDQHDRPNGVN